MSKLTCINHVIVTPCRDEIEFLPEFASSVIDQTITPRKWVIISDNSKKDTNHFLSKISNKHDWITVVKKNDGKKRKRGKHIANLVNTGISVVNSEWEFLSKIDADMVLPVDYFERLFSKFMNSKRLGIASGNCYVEHNGRKRIEKVPNDHARGGLKTYNRHCFDDIGGIKEIDGWDGIDNLTAQMNGWETHSFDDLEVLHQRSTGSHYGLLSGCFEAGQFAHAMGYYPPFLFARSLHRMLRRPFVIGGLAMFLGYSFCIIQRKKRNLDPEVISYLRHKQKRRLKALLKRN